MNLTLNYSLLLKNNIGDNGLDLEKLQSLQFQDIYQKVNSQIKNGELAFIEMTGNKNYIDLCKQSFAQISWAKQMIVVGIGGADLGPKMLQQSLQTENPPMEILYAGDTTDPQFYFELEKKIDYQNCVINVISKSGTTVETISAYLFLKQKFQEKLGDDWKKHFIFTTDKEKGILREEADQLGLLTIPTPDGVGDRFAVLSCLGLLPALAMGIDIDKLVDSASQTFQKLAESEISQNIAWQIFYYQYLLSQEKNIKTVVMMPYVARLEMFAFWFRQIWGESLGKSDNGILPIKAQGPADQHSQLQFYNEGPWLSSFIFLSLKNYNHNTALQNTDIEKLNYFNGKDFQSIVKNELQSTQITLSDYGRPSVSLELEKLDEENLGALIAVFQLATVYFANVVGIDPFDQPGVENSRQYMYGLTGQPGFEDKAQEFRTKLEKVEKFEIEL